jgi:hypothetical protein
MGALGIDTACDICGGNPQMCDEETRTPKDAKADSALFFPADKSQR